MQTTQFRDSKLVRKDYVDFYDFSQSGTFAPRTTGTGFKIQKGDTFPVECWCVCVCVCERFSVNNVYVYASV